MSLPICVYEKEVDVDLNKRVGGTYSMLTRKGCRFFGTLPTNIYMYCR